MSNMNNTDLSTVFEAQLSIFKARFLKVPPANVDSFDDASIDEQVTAPWLLIESVEMDVDDEKPGAGNNTWLNVQYQLHCILPCTVEKTDIECKNFAAYAIKVIRKNKWGLPNVGTPERINAFPGNYSNNPTSFKSWIVSWWQTVSVAGEWQPPSFLPEKTFVSESPYIGEEHREDYEELSDGFINITTP